MCNQRPPLVFALLLVAVCGMVASSNDDGVCGSLDIRNTVSGLKVLENCTVIEGYLRIVLIERGLPEQYENYTFPKLREITDYLLLYRVFGLPSIGKLFPNLAVIRGRELVHNYAFIVAHTQLEQIGLTNLMSIVRGNVLIEHNHKLCFADTIDWDMIAPSGSHLLKNNRPPYKCQNCVSSKCPTSSRFNEKEHAGDQFGKLCWNEQQCQKICSPLCTNGCNPDNLSMCCNVNCNGGCTGPGPADCIACNLFKHDGKCVNTCPNGTYEYFGRRCLTKPQCEKLSKRKHYKAFEGDETQLYKRPRQCILDCPAGYKEDQSNKHQCLKCEGRCEKVCQETYLNSIGKAQELKGCTTINGSLVISIDGKRGANIVKELEDGLKDLKRITGYLKVSRSRPLMSLHFLRNLEMIEGQKMERNNYSLLIFDNDNLQELFPFNRSAGRTQLKILKGRIFFHLNPKLCLKYIEELKIYSEIAEYKDSTWSDYDVSPHSNGEKVPCNVTNLKVKISRTSKNVAHVKYENFLKKLYDQRSLLGYLIYSKEAPYKNVTYYDGRDACNANDWVVRDVPVDVEGEAEWEDTIIVGLKPFTQYALFVKTYTMYSEKKGAISDIIYFTTKPTEPTPPTNLRAIAVNTNEVTIEWNPPKVPNGNITYYVVRGTRDKNYELRVVKEKNYCEEPLVYSTSRGNFTKEPESAVHWLDNATSNNVSDSDNKCCSCDKEYSSGISGVDENLQGQRREIEDQIINMLYIKYEVNDTDNDELDRRKRNIPQGVQLQNISTGIDKDVNGLEKNTTDKEPELPPFPDYFEFRVEAGLQVTVQNLSHFSEYDIKVQACLDEKPDEGNNCSAMQITSVRTLSLGGADDIAPSSVDIKHDANTTGTLLLSWDEPETPNGAIISYEVEYKRHSTEKSDPIKRCVTRANYLANGRMIRLTDLSPGNYSFRLRSKSLAGIGNWTTEIYRVVPSTGNIATAVIVLTVLGVLLFIIVFVTATWYYVRRKIANMPEILYASVNPEYLSAGYMYEADEWEVPREKVRLLKELGQGSFGMVFEGELNDHIPGEPQVICAVKTVNDTASHRDKQNFLQEATVMKAFNCNHVVKLLGVVSVGHPAYVLMEIMSNGDLRSFLRSHRRDEEGNDEDQVEPPTLKEILKMAAEIADGMAYLAAKKFVHRDLAARNCMVSGDMTVKIGDFGMTRDIYETDYYRKGGKGLLPVRWMAPESLKDGVFTSQSDVWSYGVVLWEMATLASQPYQGLANEQVLKFVINGGIMDRPENCPEKLYRLMRLCWTKNPKQRPTFTELIEMLIPDVVNNYERFKEVSFYFTQRPQMLLKSQQQQQEKVNASTPLRKSCDSDQNEGDNSCSDSEETGDLYTIKYFPSRMKVPESVDEQTLQIDENDEIDIKNHKNDDLTNTSKVKSVSMLNNENSKNNASSDGSKGSKVSSTTSNGSIANGHISMYSTTAC